MSLEPKSPGFLSISKAHNYLIEKGICAEDGSGDPDVEALFTRIAIVRKALEDLRQENARLTMMINQIMYWL